MLRINQSSHAAAAKSYYSTADYYTEGQELVGIWRGEGSKRLGLAGEVRRGDWEALCDNRDPRTGEVLTSRQRSQRRVGYDFNFHVPKSVSVIYGLTQDPRILDAFRDSVQATMEDMELEMKARVRADGRNEDRITGNMVWGEFIHTTARPVDGIPDPHLHAHCFVQNVTWDGQEQKWKAGQFADLKRDAPFFEAVFHARLARKMEDLGLPVARTRKGWELAGLDKATLDKFSRRTALIEEKARDEGITDIETKAALGARTRRRKAKELSYRELQEQWQARLTEDEGEGVKRVADRIGGDRIGEDDRQAEEAARHAVDHCFERSSVVTERRLLTEAMKRAYGAASPESVAARVKEVGVMAAERDGQRWVTTSQVLEEEKAMIDFAREGRGSCRRLGSDAYPLRRDWLSDEQRRAVRHLLTSPDRVMVVRGGAGTGKTSMMQEAVEAIEAGGKRVLTLAPSAAASRDVLRSEGFGDADTVARLLVDSELQESARNGVMWVDEAGLLGTRQMGQVFGIAERVNARVILSGDTRQHRGVERGAALRLLETEAGLVPAELREIRRQRDDYKKAVNALSEGRIDDGLQQLDQLGWIKEVSDEERYQLLARDYVVTVTEGKSALVVSPTHREGGQVSEEIRGRLKQAGKLSGEERPFVALKNLNLTEAERADLVNYQPGDVLLFHQNAKGHRKSERVLLNEKMDNLPLSEAAKFQVFRPHLLPIAQGDQIRITRNGKTSVGNHRLNNGAIFTLKKFDADGNIILTNGWKIDRDYGHLAHGYVVTSHASQGKTVDRVFIAMSDVSMPASSREQFYVSCSRGRESARIYCDDSESLLQAVSRSDDRLSATQVMAEERLRDRSQLQRRLDLMEGAAPTAVMTKAREQEQVRHER